MKTRLKFQLTATVGKSYAPFVRRHLHRAAGMLPGPLCELSLVFVGDRRMAELHERFMNLPTPTDVLTFPIDQDGRGRAVSGEVYVCVPEARRQAANRGVRVEHELLLYSLHGLLHLSGFDDRTGPEYRRMHRKEDDILTRLGIGRVFERAEEADGAKPQASRRRGPRRRGEKA